MREQLQSPCNFVPITPRTSDMDAGIHPMTAATVVDSLELVTTANTNNDATVNSDKTQKDCIVLHARVDNFNSNLNAAASEAEITTMPIKQPPARPRKCTPQYPPTKEMIKRAYTDLKGHYRKGLTTGRLRDFIAKNYIKSPRDLKTRMKLVRRYFNKAVAQGNFICSKRNGFLVRYTPTEKYLQYLHRCERRARLAKNKPATAVAVKRKIKTPVQTQTSKTKSLQKQICSQKSPEKCSYIMSINNILSTQRSFPHIRIKTPNFLLPSGKSLDICRCKFPH